MHSAIASFQQDLHAEGTIRSIYADLQFEQRLIQVCSESRRNRWSADAAVCA